MKKDSIEGKFLDELRMIPIVQLACQRCNISRQSVYRWRSEDPEFAEKMEDALEEGNAYMNDLGETQLVSLIKERKFQAIRYYLDRVHPKYRKQKIVIEKEDDSSTVDIDRVHKELGLTREDFEGENRMDTILRVAEYLSNR